MTETSGFFGEYDGIEKHQDLSADTIWPQSQVDGTPTVSLYERILQLDGAPFGMTLEAFATKMCLEAEGATLREFEEADVQDD